MRYFILGASSIFTLVCLAIVTAFAPYLYPQTLLAERNVRSAYRRLHDVTNHAHSATTAINNVGGAKDIFLRNLERKQAGDEVSSSELDANIASLMAEVDRTGLPSPPGTTTLVGNLQSWRGRWRICHAPHIEALGKILLTSFPIVDYYFPSEDGRMLSNARYESAVFGSGWLNADGRIEKLGDDSSVAASSSVKENEQGGAGDTAVHRKGQVVKVVFERFWWDRNGEEQPTPLPPSASAIGNNEPAGPRGMVDSVVQAAGKALFFEGLSNFPVRYLDNDLCVFEFKAVGTVVASQRIE